MAAKRKNDAAPVRAPQVLARRADQIEGLLVDIAEAVRERAGHYRDSQNWNHAGDLSHVLSKLLEIDAFMRDGGKS